MSDYDKVASTIVDSIKEIYGGKHNEADQTSCCKVISKSSRYDNCYNLQFAGDESGILSDIPNGTPYDLQPGETVYIYKIGNSIFNSFICYSTNAKYRPIRKTSVDNITANGSQGTSGSIYTKPEVEEEPAPDPGVTPTQQPEPDVGDTTANLTPSQQETIVSEKKSSFTPSSTSTYFFTPFTPRTGIREAKAQDGKYQESVDSPAAGRSGSSNICSFPGAYASTEGDSSTSPDYNKVAYNRCVVSKRRTHSTSYYKGFDTLPNCRGQFEGRMLEIRQEIKDQVYSKNSDTGNLQGIGNLMYNKSSSTLEKTSNRKAALRPGMCIMGSDYHGSIVEKLISANKIIMSDSHYNAYASAKTITEQSRGSDGTWGALNAGLNNSQFKGYIYHPDVKIHEVPGTYKQVEYLQGDCIQCNAAIGKQQDQISSFFSFGGSTNFAVRVEVALMTKKVGARARILYSTSSEGNVEVYFDQTNQDIKLKMDINKRSGGKTTYQLSDLNFQTKVKYTIKLFWYNSAIYSCAINREEINKLNYSQGSLSMTDHGEMFLFRRVLAGGGDADTNNGGVLRYYSITFVKKGSIIGLLKPVLRYDGVSGFYDAVRDSFFQCNSNTTIGSFLPTTTIDGKAVCL